MHKQFSCIYDIQLRYFEKHNVHAHGAMDMVNDRQQFRFGDKFIICNDLCVTLKFIMKVS